MDVGDGGSLAPALAAGGELNIDASFGAARNACRASLILTGEAQHGVGTLEEVGMVLNELAQADVHALFVALRHKDEIHRQLAHDLSHGHKSLKLRELRPFGVHRATADKHLLERRIDPGGLAVDDAPFKWRCHP